MFGKNLQVKYPFPHKNIPQKNKTIPKDMFQWSMFLEKIELALWMKKDIMEI